MTTDGDSSDGAARVGSTSGRFDASGKSARVVKAAILRGPDGEGPLSQLTISNLELGADEDLDLSFETVDTRLILHGGTLGGGLDATRATLSGLELYDVKVAWIDLDWARVEGDLRLVNVHPPTAEAPAAPAGEEPGHDEKPSENDGPERTSVSCVGAVITGEVSVPGSGVSETDADALLARHRRPAPAAGGGFNWDRVFQAVGLGSALVAWVAVVGGATLWARLESIDAPALPTLAALGQSWMVTAGLQTLLVPMLLGASVALLVYFSRWNAIPTSAPHGRDFRAESQSERSAQAEGQSERSAQAEGQSERSAQAEGQPERSAQAEGQRDGPVPKRRRRGERDAAAGADSAAGDAFQLHRARPLVALERLRQRTRRVAVFVVAVIGAMLAAALYVAQASWEVLVTTLVIVVLAILVVGYLTNWVQAGREKPKRWLAAAAVLVGGAVVGLAWWGGGASGWQAVVAGVVAAVVVLVLVAVGFWSDVAFAWATLVVAVVGVFLSLLVTVTLGWLLFMAAVTLLSLWASLGALVDRSQGAAAITVFAAIVVWSGALQYAREIGDRTPEFPTATVQMKSGAPMSGLLVGRTSDVVLVADTTATEGSRTVHVLPADQVQQVDYGHDVVPPNTSHKGEGEWWALWTLTFLVPNDVADSANAAETQVENKDTSTADEVGQPEYERVPHPEVDRAKALDRIDEEVAGVPVRLELLGVERSNDVIYLWLRVVNMDDKEAHDVSDLLGLDQGELNSPRLVDSADRRAYLVSTRNAGCDCTGLLDTVNLDPYHQRNVHAEFVVPRSVSTVDVTVPAFGTFHNVDVVE